MPGDRVVVNFRGKEYNGRIEEIDKNLINPLLVYYNVDNTIQNVGVKDIIRKL